MSKSKEYYTCWGISQKLNKLWKVNSRVDETEKGTYLVVLFFDYPGIPGSVIIPADRVFDLFENNRSDLYPDGVTVDDIWDIDDASVAYHLVVSGWVSRGGDYEAMGRFDKLIPSFEDREMVQAGLIYSRINPGFTLSVTPKNCKLIEERLLTYSSACLSFPGTISGLEQSVAKYNLSNWGHNNIITENFIRNIVGYSTDLEYEIKDFQEISLVDYMFNSIYYYECGEPEILYYEPGVGLGLRAFGVSIHFDSYRLAEALDYTGCSSFEDTRERDLLLRELCQEGGVDLYRASVAGSALRDFFWKCKNTPGFKEDFLESFPVQQDMI